MNERTTQFVAVCAIVLIGVAGLFITIGLFNLGNTGTTTTTSDTTTTDTTTETTTDTTTTTTDTTTTDTTTTTTTTTTEEPVELTVLTHHDISFQGIFEPAFLSSSFAIENNIDNIKWRAPAEEFWDDLIDIGEVDVCWGGPPQLYDQLMVGDYLSPLTSTLMQEVESRVNDTIAGVAMKGNNTEDQLCWIGSTLSSFGFTINHVFLSTYSLPVPTTWANLSEPIYGSLLPTIPTIAMANAPYSTSHKYMYDLIVQIMGWDAGWTHLSRMAGSAEIYGGSVETQNAVEIGDNAVCPSMDFDGFLTQSRNPDCEYIVPADGTAISCAPIAIANPNVNMTIAEGFIDFVLSPYGQSLLLDEDLLRLPIMREAFDEPGAIGMDDMYSAFNQTISSTPFVLNMTQSLVTDRSFTKYFESVLTDSHVELANCWSTMVELYYAGNITKSELDAYATLMANPVTIVDPKTSLDEKFTIDYATRINSDMIFDAAYSSTVQSRWTVAAKVQYLSVKSDLDLIAPYLGMETETTKLIGSIQAILTFFFSTGGFVVLAFRGSKYN
ncbi:MAG: ABC transporter substrate-binding protein [Candidatus Thorarchaeota archaeon]